MLVSESFGWTHPAGIYPGEQLLVMLATDKNGRLTPDWFPLAKGIGHDKFLFQTMRNPYLCWVLPPPHHVPASLFESFLEAQVWCRPLST